jgi:ABC-type antimicrobial peptide transport system permease subunit
MLLLGIAAGVALLLGAVGLYGVISYGVTQRRQEIGVRMALGAPAGRVRGMVVRQGAVIAGVGLAVGFAVALGLTRVMEALLFEVSPTDPPTFGLVVALLFVVSILASWLPARRAASVDPAIALRAE